MKTIQMSLAWVVLTVLIVLVCVAFVKDCFADDRDTGFSGDVNVGVAVYDTDEKEKPERDCDVKPTVFAKLKYTFENGNQIYLGTPLENEGEPTETTEEGFGGKFILNIRSFKASYEKYSVMVVGGVVTHDSSIEFYDRMRYMAL